MTSFSTWCRALNRNGRYLCGNPRLSVMLCSLLTSWLTDKTATFAFAGETREQLLALKDMIEAGAIRSIVDRVLPISEAAAAHRLVETEQRIGAIVLAIGGDEQSPTAAA